MQRNHAAIAMFFILLLSYVLNSIDRGLFSVLAIEVRDAMSLSLPQVDQFGMALDNINLDVYAGEVVGIAGGSGNGQQELLAALSGEDPRAPRNTIRMFDTDISRAARLCGVLSPGSRKTRGLGR